jgi:hypothetical protein
MRVKGNKKCLPILLNLVRQYKAQAIAKHQQSIQMILKMFEEKVKEYERSPFSISMRYGNSVQSNEPLLYDYFDLDP